MLEGVLPSLGTLFILIILISSLSLSLASLARGKQLMADTHLSISLRPAANYKMKSFGQAIRSSAGCFSGALTGRVRLVVGQHPSQAFSFPPQRNLDSTICINIRVVNVCTAPLMVTMMSPLYVDVHLSALPLTGARFRKLGASRSIAPVPFHVASHCRFLPISSI